MGTPKSIEDKIAWSEAEKTEAEARGREHYASLDEQGLDELKAKMKSALKRHAGNDEQSDLAN